MQRWLRCNLYDLLESMKHDSIHQTELFNNSVNSALNAITKTETSVAKRLNYLLWSIGVAERKYLSIWVFDDYMMIIWWLYDDYMMINNEIDESYSVLFSYKLTWYIW